MENVTRVKVRESVDTVIAAGNECGMLFVFQLSCDIHGILSQVFNLLSFRMRILVSFSYIP